MPSVHTMKMETVCFSVARLHDVVKSQCLFWVEFFNAVVGTSTCIHFCLCCVV